MSLVSVHLGFAQAVNGVGIGFAAPRVEGQQPYGKQSQRHTAQAGIAIVHREGGEHRAADNRADGIAEVKRHLYSRAGDQLAAALAGCSTVRSLWMPRIASSIPSKIVIKPKPPASTTPAFSSTGF